MPVVDLNVEDCAAMAPVDGCASHGLGSVMGSNVMVNQVLDMKGPLKGKGGSPLARWQSEASTRLASVHAEMEVLAQATREVPGRDWALNLYKQRGDAKQLRWRMRNSRHSLWERIEPLLDQLPPGLAQWYREIQEQSDVLNHREQAARYELKTVIRLTEQKPRRSRNYTGEN